MPGRRPARHREAVARPARRTRSASGGVLLFGIPRQGREGSGAWDDEGVVQLATRAIKDAHPDCLVCTDLGLCEYTDHGHCGLLTPDGAVDNDPSLELLARAAVAQARAGATSSPRAT
jgi:porphobilinogen synthase